MKRLMIILLSMLLLLPFSVQAQVYEDRNINNYGHPIIRIINNTPRPFSCFYRDASGYYTFILYPGTTSGWFLIYGQYQWGCE